MDPNSRSCLSIISNHKELEEFKDLHEEYFEKFSDATAIFTKIKEYITTYFPDIIPQVDGQEDEEENVNAESEVELPKTTAAPSNIDPSTVQDLPSGSRSVRVQPTNPLKVNILPETTNARMNRNQINYDTFTPDLYFDNYIPTPTNYVNNDQRDRKMDSLLEMLVKHQCGGTNRSKLRAPELVLPEFHGEAKTHRSFKDMFNLAIEGTDMTNTFNFK